MHSLREIRLTVGNHGDMSTSIGRFARSHFRPGLVTALVQVAMIGSSRGRSFLDDDRELSDIADFVPTDEAPRLEAAAIERATAVADPLPGDSHPVAA
jgi:hypothetical protein